MVEINVGTTVIWAQQRPLMQSDGNICIDVHQIIACICFQMAWLMLLLKKNNVLELAIDRLGLPHIRIRRAGHS
jgi:hypothetical protein